MRKVVITLLLSCGPSAFAQSEVTLGDLEDYSLSLGNSWNSSPYSSYTPTEEDLNNLNNQLSDTFSFSTTEGIESTIIYNNRGSLTYGVNSNGDYVIVETPSNTYRGQAQNLSYSEDGSRYSLFGDQLSLTSDNNDDSVYIDQFSLSKDDDEFQFDLSDIAVQASTSWGAEELTYTDGNEGENFNATKLYIRKENGDYIELGQGSYSSQSNALQIKSLKGQQGEYQFSADEIAYIEDDDSQQLSTTSLFVTNEAGDYIDIGQADLKYSDDSKTLSLESLSSQYEGKSLQAQSFQASQTGEDYQAAAKEVFIQDELGNFIKVGEADYSSATSTLNITDLAGQKDGISLSSDTISLFSKDGQSLLTGTNIFIADEAGAYVSIGKASFAMDETTQALNLTSIDAMREGYHIKADSVGYFSDSEAQTQQLAITNGSIAHYENEQNAAVGSLSLYQTSPTNGTQTTGLTGTNLSFAQGTDSLNIGRVQGTQSGNSGSLVFSNITGAVDQYQVATDQFSIAQTEDDTTVEAKGVYIKDELGNFIKIGEANYSDQTSTLNITSLAGQKDGMSLSADQVSLFQRDDQSLLQGTNIYIDDGANGHVNIAHASLAMDENTQSLSLTSIDAVKDGYTLTSDKISYFAQGDAQQIGITNGRATGQDLDVSFSGADITSNGDRLSVSARDFSYSDSSMGYRTDRLDYSSDGDSFDINTRGTLSVSGTDLDVVANARGIDSISQGIKETTDSEGNTRIDGHFAIGTTDEGGIKELGVALGDAVSFSAKDADGNATELSANFSYDEKTKTFYLKTVFKNGDKTEIKVMPFTFESEKVGEDAVAALSIKLNEQNIEEYLDTVTSIIDFHEVNKHLAIGRGGMRVRLGGGFGTEFTFTETNGVFDSRINADDPNYSLGLGLFSRGEHSTQSVGVLMSSDSNMSYNIHNGKLSVAGIELPDYGEIPLTIGTYYSYQNDEGTAVFATLGTSLAEFEDLPITAGVGVKWEDENKSFRVGVVADSHGDYAAGINFQYRFGGSVNNSSRSRFNNYDSYDSYNPRDISSYSSIRNR